jgi:hypothetical protein
LALSTFVLAALALIPAAGSRAKTRPHTDAQEQAVVNNAPASLNLKDFGAAGDGSTDDGPALKAALDALRTAGGGTLFVPAGRYAIVTPISKDFTGVSAPVTISGVVSNTQVPPPTATGQQFSHGLDLTTEFLPRTGTSGIMLRLSGLRNVVINDIAFVGTPDATTDAVNTLAFVDVEDATVNHCEFYGLASLVGSDVIAVRSKLKISRSVFLGSTANSGVYASVVQNLEWKGFTIEEAVFLDYGQRPELFGKTGVAAPLAWVELGNAAAVTNDSPRREAVFRSVFLDEGGRDGITSLPGRYPDPPSAPIDLVYVTNLHMNVSNLGSSGHYLSGLRAALVESSAYGWSHNCDAAINLVNVGDAILDRVETTASATRLRADSSTSRLTVIDSVYQDLASSAAQTFVINTTQPDQDPVQYVRDRFESALGRAPDAAGHFYWSDKILLCGSNAQCVTSARAALDAYLATSPAENFQITGRVSDENNLPVGGASVALTGSQSASTTTDSAGLYHFSNLPTSGVYTVTVSKSFYNIAAPSKTFTTPAGDSTADFVGTFKRFTISGHLTDDAGHALAGASVALTGSQAATATTDANGNYVLTGVGAGGNYTVTPTKAHYAFTPQSRGFSNLDGDKAADFAATLLRHKISGRVTKSDGSALAGVSVALTGAQAATATTDSSGNYTFANLAGGGSYTVTPTLRHYTFAPASKQFNDLGADQSAPFVATLDTHTVSGRVTKSDGSAFAGVTLSLTGSKTATATSDANGNYSFAGLNGGGSYTVTASKTNYNFAPASKQFADLSANQTANFTASLVNFRISGRVTLSGSGFGGVTIKLTGSQTASATTAPDGSYSFNMPAEGSYLITPSKTHYSFTPQSQTFTNLAGDKTADFVATLDTHTVSGRVTKQDGSGLAGVSMALTGSKTATATTDSAGNYSFAGLNGGGSYTVTPTLRHYTFSPASKQFNDLGANQTANFAATIDTHTVSGRVTKQDGSGLAGVTLSLSGSNTATTTTDAAGNYSFTGLGGGGSYTVTPTKAHYTFAPASSTFGDLSANQTANFTATLVNFRISGRVNLSGSGLGGVTVTLSGSNSATATTAADGSYSFSVPAEGGYTVTPSKAHYTFAPQSQSFGNLGGDKTADFDATLDTHTVSGRVTKQDGSAFAGVTLSLTGSKTATATSDANGNYSFAGLNGGGSYTVTASKTNYNFSPPSGAFADLSANQAANFTAALVNFRIGGRVTLNGSGLGGVTIKLTGSQTASATTAPDGSYSFNMPAEGDYLITPAKAHYTFAPQSQTFTDLVGDKTADFDAAVLRFTINGSVVGVNNTGIQGVSVALTGAQAATATTAADGSYSFPNLAADGTYTVTPALAGQDFSPASRTFAGLDDDTWAGFVADIATYHIAGRVTNGGAGVAGVSVDLEGTHPLLGAASGHVVTGADGSYTFDVRASGSYTVTPSKKDNVFTPASASFNTIDGSRAADFDAEPTEVVEFASASLSVGEGGGALEVTVTREGDTSAEVSAVYEVQSGTALRGSDVVGSAGRVTFAPGETTKTFQIFITDDSLVEGAENFSVGLKPEGDAVAGQLASVAVTIDDNDTDPTAANAIEDAQFFVRQHYRDFLGRDPDDDGLKFWTEQITSCGADAGCRDVKRINVSAAFFFSIEFQNTGFFVYKTYEAAYGRVPDRLMEFTLDSREIGEGLIVGKPGWEQKLETGKTAYVEEFVARDEFGQRYPLTLSPAQFVSALDANAGDSLTPEEEAAAAEEFNGSNTTEDIAARARVLRMLVENGEFHRRETNPAFVQMEYIGYLRRAPDDPPNTNLDGYNFWLKKLEDFNGDWRAAEMVKAFISSDEYRKRFGN